MSRQNYGCRDKRFVATSILSSRQKTCFVFVATKMIRVAAPACLFAVEEDRGKNEGGN